MSKTRQRKLEQHGWTTGSAADFLGLTAEESAYIEIKLVLGSKPKDIAKAIDTSRRKSR